VTRTSGTGVGAGVGVKVAVGEGMRLGVAVAKNESGERLEGMLQLNKIALTSSPKRMRRISFMVFFILSKQNSVKQVSHFDRFNF
jgi:hypothetical protein